MRNWFVCMPPDFRPETISFNLHDALIGNDSFLLEPFDLIHVLWPL